MIETNYHLLSEDIFQECNRNAKELGITLDHFLLEWCDIEGPLISSN